MNINWLTLRDLEYVVAVAEFLHFGKAAKNCHVSQPALSVQTKKLEDQLGIQIFERSNRSVLITEAGQVVLAQARIVLEEANKLGRFSNQNQSPLTGSLRLGAIFTIGPYLIPQLLQPLKKSFPQSKLLIREGFTEDLIHQLRAGSLDAVLASPTFKADGLRVIPLFYEPLLLAAPKNHPLLKKDSLKSSDLNVNEMLLLEEGHCLKDQTVEICSVNRRGNQQEFQATGLETLKYMVAEGLGYTLVPALAAKPDSRLGNLIQYRSFSSKSVGREVVLVSRARSSEMRDLESLAQLIRDHSV